MNFDLIPSQANLKEEKFENWFCFIWQIFNQEGGKLSSKNLAAAAILLFRTALPATQRLYSIEEGRAASKSPHQKFGYFLSISQQGDSADIIQKVCLLVVSLVAIPPHTVCTVLTVLTWWVH
jgi:hypothetical protein